MLLQKSVQWRMLWARLGLKRSLVGLYVYYMPLSNNIFHSFKIFEVLIVYLVDDIFRFSSVATLEF